MIGIEFICPNHCDTLAIIGGVVEMLDDDYRCDISGDEMYLTDKEKKRVGWSKESSLMQEGCSKNELASLMLGDRLETLVAIEVFCYPKDDEWVEIQTYDDYKKSSCQVIILVCDVNYVEVYAKDESFLKNCYDFVSKLGIAVEEKTEENDGRIRMHVW